MSAPVRAILASEFWPGATGRGIAPGLRAAGWLVDEIDIRQYFPPGHSLRSRFEGRLRYREREAAFQRAILASAKTHSPDVFLTIKGIGIRKATLDALRQRGTTLVNYYPDRDIGGEEAQLYDLFVTTKSFHLDILRNLVPSQRFAFLHHGYDVEIHRPVDRSVNEPVDVLYVGNASPYKARLMIALTELMPQTSIRVIGHNWHKFAKGTPLERFIIGSAEQGDYYAAEIANSKITLAFHMGPKTESGCQDLVSTRTFEIPACGGFMLHIDNEEVRSLYDVGSEIDVFSSAQDMAGKVRYWLDNPEHRAAVAARGHSRAVPAYSYFERGRNLASLIEERLPPR